MIVDKKDQIKPKSFKIVRCEPSHRSIRHGMKKKDFPISFSSWEKLDKFLVEKSLLLKSPKKFITCFIEIEFEDSFTNTIPYRVRHGAHKRINLKKQMSKCLHSWLEKCPTAKKKRWIKFFLERYNLDHEHYVSNEALRLKVIEELDQKLEEKLKFHEEISHPKKEKREALPTLAKHYSTRSKPCPYPAFKENEIVSLKYVGRDWEEIHGVVWNIDEMVNVKFLKWEPKTSNPFGYDLHVLKDNEMVDVIDDQKIKAINKVSLPLKDNFKPVLEARSQARC